MRPLPPSLQEKPDQLYRLLVRVPLPYVEKVRTKYAPRGQKTLLADIKDRLRLSGFAPLLVTQDPTDNSLLAAIARKPDSSPSSAPIQRDPIVRVIKQEPVDEPLVSTALGQVKQDRPRGDNGLSEEEAQVVHYALMNERNPRHLEGLASSLEPFFPISASLLRAKGLLIENRKVMDEGATKKFLESACKKSDTNPDVIAKKQAFETFAQSSGSPIEVLRDEVKRAALKMAEEANVPSAKPPPILQHAPAPVLELARTIVRQVPDNTNLAMICPDALKVSLPPKATDGFISPSAMQLALAASKPDWSGVSSKDKLDAVMQSLKGKPGMNPQDLMKARNQMERAAKAIERRRWIEWYKRSVGVYTNWNGIVPTGQS